MLSYKLWVYSRLVNGACTVVMQTIYTLWSISPKLLPYVLPTSDSYIRPPWDQSQPKHVLIPPINHSNRKQFPLKVAWELNIHANQGLTLKRSTIEIGNNECQGLAFIAMLCIATLEGMWIALSFSLECYAKMKDTSYVWLQKKKRYTFILCPFHT